jgi:hypothetical protein
LTGRMWERQSSGEYLWLRGGWLTRREEASEIQPHPCKTRNDGPPKSFFSLRGSASRASNPFNLVRSLESRVGQAEPIRERQLCSIPRVQWDESPRLASSHALTPVRHPPIWACRFRCNETGRITPGEPELSIRPAT